MARKQHMDDEWDDSNIVPFRLYMKEWLYNKLIRFPMLQGVRACAERGQDRY